MKTKIVPNKALLLLNYKSFGRGVLPFCSPFLIISSAFTAFSGLGS